MKFKKVSPNALPPVYATEGAACFDLRACLDAPIELYSGSTAVINTGLACEVPKGYVMLIFSRSGQGFVFDVRLSNCVGVIDPDYRGAICVKLIREPLGDETSVRINHGDRIAQALLVPALQPAFEFADELEQTARGAGGFGSTGVL